MITTTTPIPAVGVGRPDYTQNIAWAAVSTQRGVQIRQTFHAYGTNVDTLPYPNAYGMVVPWYNHSSAVVYVVPDDLPAHMQSLHLTTPRDVLKTIQLFRFASWADYLLWNVEKLEGELWGYGALTLRWSKGMPAVTGRVYVIGFGEFSNEVHFDVSIQLHNILEEVVYG